MLLINLAISLINVLKVNALECLSVINRECMPRPKILNVNGGIGEALFYPYNVLVLKVRYLIIILWISLKKGRVFCLQSLFRVCLPYSIHQ